jgi:hypothetical protein
MPAPSETPSSKGTIREQSDAFCGDCKDNERNYCNKVEKRVRRDNQNRDGARFRKDISSPQSRETCARARSDLGLIIEVLVQWEVDSINQIIREAIPANVWVGAVPRKGGVDQSPVGLDFDLAKDGLVSSRRGSRRRGRAHAAAKRRRARWRLGLGVGVATQELRASISDRNGSLGCSSTRWSTVLLARCSSCLGPLRGGFVAVTPVIWAVGLSVVIVQVRVDGLRERLARALATCAAASSRCRLVWRGFAGCVGHAAATSANRRKAVCDIATASLDFTKSVGVLLDGPELELDAIGCGLAKVLGNI